MANREIWTVVFNDETELFLLKMQLESLIIHNNTFKYNIIINEYDSSPVLDYLKSEDFNMLIEASSFPIEIFKRQDILSDHEVTENGYVDQQLLKLFCHYKTDVEEIVILDPKNIAMWNNPIDLVKPYAQLKKLIHFHNCFSECIERWHKEKIVFPRPYYTPYLFKKQILIQLEKDFETRKKYLDFLIKRFSEPSKTLKKFLKKDPRLPKYTRLSEFIIYNMFEQTLPNYTLIQNNYPKNVCFPKLDSEFYDGLFISIHRKEVEGKNKSIVYQKIKKLRNKIAKRRKKLYGRTDME